MFDLDLVAWSKIISLCIFFPIYVGALVYAFWKPNKAKFDAASRIPLLDD